MTPKYWQDPETYAAMQVPHENTAAAHKAQDDFYDEVQALRKKYRIPNLHVILHMKVLVSGETEGEQHIGDTMSSCHLGDTLQAVQMCAFAYGRQRAIFDEAVSGALTGRVSGAK